MMRLKALAIAGIACLLSMTAYAAVSPPILTIVLPESTYVIGDYSIGAQTVPLDYNVGRVRLSRAAWTNPASHISWTIELSQDSGSTWAPLATGGSSGGVVINPRTGLPHEYSEISVPLAQTENVNRRVRAVFSVSGASATTELTAILEAR